ncbi:hypothetical protein KGY64_06685, partial [Candidatus Bipolaricaulota bacterium]|nr:hypothetical protein [Candidatus Bipolaricaulota bacterium]
MKLNKFKVGLIFTLLLSLFLAVSGFAAPEYVENTNTWIIDEQAEFEQLVGMKLSAVDFDGDGQPDIKAGDTLALGPDPTLFTQDASITIDLQNIAIEGNDDTLVIIEQETVGGEYGDYETVHIGYDEVTGSQITENVTSSIVIEEEGAQLRNLVFEPVVFSQAAGTPVDSNNAVLVNVTDFCACGGRPMAFENVQMPECGSCCDFDYGFRFTGKVEDWGGRNTSYSNIDFKDVKIKGVSTNAIEFASSVGDVSNINLDKMYLGNSGACGQCEEDPENQGYGLYFTNNGALEDVTLENSNGLEDGGMLKDSEYGIENNTDGIRINGDYVTSVDNLHITDVDIQNNCDNGISIIGKWDPCADDIEGFTNSLIRSIDITVENTEISGNGDPLDEVIEGHFDGGFG